MSCAPGLVFGGTKGVGSRFRVLRALTRFHLYQGRRIPFQCSAIPDSFSTVPRVVRSRFHILRVRTHFRRYRESPIPFSCFPVSDMFSAVSRVSGPFFMFCAPELVFDGTVGIGSRFYVLRSRTSFRRYRVRSLFHVLRAQTLFRLYRGHRVLFSCFAILDSFSAEPRASGPVFMFCATGLIFGGTEGVGSLSHVLRYRTRFRRYRGRRVSFSRFVQPDSFSEIPGALGPVF
jgi:hypothetical protein